MSSNKHQDASCKQCTGGKVAHLFSHMLNTCLYNGPYVVLNTIIHSNKHISSSYKYTIEETRQKINEYICNLIFNKNIIKKDKNMVL